MRTIHWGLHPLGGGNDSRCEHNKGMGERESIVVVVRKNTLLKNSIKYGAIVDVE